MEEESLSDKEEAWRALSGIKEIFETAFKFAVESNAPLMIIWTKNVISPNLK